MAGRHHLPRRRRRDHLGRGPHPRRRGAAVAVVLPYGSRVATSRINFRLLARDALTHDKRLSIVAGGSGDAGARRVGRAAGLRVGRRVRDRREEAPRPAPGAGSGCGRRRRRGRGSGRPRRGRRAAGTTDRPRTAPATARPDRPRREPEGAAQGGRGQGRAPGRCPAEPAAAPPATPFQQTLDDAEAAELAAAAAALQAEARTQATPAGWSPPRAEPLPPADGPAPRTTAVTRASGSGSGGSGGTRTPLLVGGLVLGFAVLVLAVAAYLFLPSATIAVTPKAGGRRPDLDDDRGRSGGDGAGPRQGRGPGRADRCRRHRHRHVPRHREARRGDGGDRLRPVPQPRLHLVEHHPGRQHREHAVRRPLPDRADDHGAAARTSSGSRSSRRRRRSR